MTDGADEQSISEILTGQTVGLHFEVSDIIIASVPLCAYTLLPGSHGEGPSLGVDLLRDTLQIAQRCTVLRLRRHEFGLTLIHQPLQVLQRGETKNQYKRRVVVIRSCKLALTVLKGPLLYRTHLKLEIILGFQFKIRPTGGEKEKKI